MLQGKYPAPQRHEHEALRLTQKDGCLKPEVAQARKRKWLGRRSVPIKIR